MGQQGKHSNSEMEMEDYGNSDNDDGSSGGQSSTHSQSRQGGSGMNDENKQQGTEDASGKGEYFGDFGNTGTGVDLTEEMENTDVRSGMVKGGESGSDDVAGPGQYGGDAGSLNSGGSGRGG